MPTTRSEKIQRLQQKIATLEEELQGHEMARKGDARRLRAEDASFAARRRELYQLYDILAALEGPDLVRLQAIKVANDLRERLSVAIQAHCEADADWELKMATAPKTQQGRHDIEQAYLRRDECYDAFLALHYELEAHLGAHGLSDDSEQLAAK